MKVSSSASALFVTLFLGLYGVPVEAESAPVPAPSGLVGVVTGSVTNAEGEALPGATVLIMGSELRTTTDQRGRFTFSRVPDGPHRITVTYVGYHPQTHPVVVAAGQAHALEFRLQPQAVAIEGLTVMGDISEGQARAQQQEKNATSIRNVISEEHIRRFPDRTAAEAVERLPGVYTHRNNGEGQAVHIRGMPPRFNSVTINGQAAPNSENTRGAASLGVIQPDLIKEITVTKALTPDMDGDAIGGSVNFTMAEAPKRPLASFQVGYGDNRTPQGQRFFGTDNRQGRFALGRRFLDDRLGVLLSGSQVHTDAGYLFDNIFYATSNGSPTDTVINRRRQTDRDVRRIRQGVVGNIDYEFNLDHRINLSASATEYNQNNITRAGEIRLATAQGRPVLASTATVMNRKLDSRIEMLSLGGEHRLGAVLLDYTLSSGTAWKEDPYATRVDFARPNVPVAAVPADTWMTYALARDPTPDAGPFTLTQTLESSERTEEAIRGGAANLQIPLNIGSGSSIKIGGKVRHQSKHNEPNYNRRRISPVEPFALAGWGAVDGFGHTSSRYIDEIAPRLRTLQDLTEGVRRDNLWDADEQITAGYLQAELHANDRLMTLVGARVERTDGELFHATQAESASRSYANVLPSLHLRYRFTPNTQVRFAATTGLARPNYVDLVPYLRPDDANLDLRRGNPALVPTTVRNLDLMLASYSSGLGQLSAGLFAKWLRNQIYNATFMENIDGRDWEVFQPLNGEKGELWGAEIAFTRRFDFMPDGLAFLRPLGVHTSYTLTRAEQTIAEGDGRRVVPLESVPEHLANLALTYDNPAIGLDWTVSTNYRSDQLRSIQANVFADTWLEKEWKLDVSASKTLYRDLSIFVTANNLLNTRESVMFGDPRQSFSRQRVDEWYGPAYSMALRYRY